MYFIYPFYKLGVRITGVLRYLYLYVCPVHHLLFNAESEQQRDRRQRSADHVGHTEDHQLAEPSEFVRYVM